VSEKGIATYFVVMGMGGDCPSSYFFSFFFAFFHLVVNFFTVSFFEKVHVDES